MQYKLANREIITYLIKTKNMTTEILAVIMTVVTILCKIAMDFLICYTAWTAYKIRQQQKQNNLL